VPLTVEIVSFPFDLHSATVFDSHMRHRAHAALKATSQSHSTARLSTSSVLSTACGRLAQVRLLPATRRTFTSVVNRKLLLFAMCLRVLMTMEIDYIRNMN